jgi:hypothetical protein
VESESESESGKWKVDLSFAVRPAQNARNLQSFSELTAQWRRLDA